MSIHAQIAEVLQVSERQIFRRLNEKHKPTMDILAAFKLAGSLGDDLTRIETVLNHAAVQLMDADPEFSKWMEGVTKRIHEYGDCRAIELIQRYRFSCQKVDRKEPPFNHWPPSDIRMEEENREATRIECLGELRT